MIDKIVWIDSIEANPPIELVHENLSTGETIIYHPDYVGRNPTQWIKSDLWVTFAD